MTPTTRAMIGVILLWMALSTTLSAQGPVANDNATTANQLTEDERQSGWLLLFDGQSTKGWMSIHGKPIAESHVQNGSLNPHRCEYMLVCDRQWDDFKLSLDFKISPKCN